MSKSIGQETKTSRFAGTLALLAAVLLLAVGSPRAEEEKTGPVYPPQRIGVGAGIPEMEFKDIENRILRSADFQDWVVVYSFADRKSNKKLQDEIAPAGVEAVRRYPGLKFAYLNIADVVGIPDVFIPLILPILRAIVDKNMKTLRDFYREKGVELEPGKTGFYMVPDWKGDYLKVFGLKNAKEYHCFVTYNHKVLAVFDSSHPPVTENYLAVFTDLVAPQL